MIALNLNNNGRKILIPNTFSRFVKFRGSQRLVIVSQEDNGWYALHIKDCLGTNRSIWLQEIRYLKSVRVRLRD
ncbi:hypothetical protein MasN3_05340 [Massilia varians]|uniref:Uncharacterized protein n=1 Tax=Massilia varians TaxID=457921 RepID=A0ABM8C1J5_9BURK|nr:hypothetical protein MasN3_05340 [Massilia varians]